MTTLKAEKRSMDVKAKRLRREGYVTGNVIGKEIAGSVPVKILKTEVERLLKTCTKGSRINLEVDGTPMDVLIKDISLNPMKGEIMEMDFQALVNGEKVHSVAEVYLLNHEKVTTGILQQHLQEIAQSMNLNIFIVSHTTLDENLFDYKIFIDKNSGFSDLTYL